VTGARCDRAHLGNSIFSILDQYLKNAVVRAYLDGARPAWSDYGIGRQDWSLSSFLQKISCELKYAQMFAWGKCPLGQIWYGTVDEICTPFGISPKTRIG